MPSIYSSKKQLLEIIDYLTAYMRIPYFQDDTVPGKVMEKIVSLVHSSNQLSNYDYVDVCTPNSLGWQVKSTKDTTPLTWKRAKIANATQLIKDSQKSKAGLQDLGNAIIDFCNEHAHHSINKYNLNEIGYSRLIMFEDLSAIYFERLIATRKKPDIFEKSAYTWSWSTQKNTVAKEQLPALHGTDQTGKKIFAWHGLGENQLHFSGEKNWWPKVKKATKKGEVNFSADGHAVSFVLPESKVSWSDLVDFLNASS